MTGGLNCPSQAIDLGTEVDYREEQARASMCILHSILGTGW